MRVVASNNQTWYNLCLNNCCSRCCRCFKWSHTVSPSDTVGAAAGLPPEPPCGYYKGARCAPRPRVTSRVCLCVQQCTGKSLSAASRCRTSQRPCGAPCIGAASFVRARAAIPACRRRVCPTRCAVCRGDNSGAWPRSPCTQPAAGQPLAHPNYEQATAPRQTVDVRDTAGAQQFQTSTFRAQQSTVRRRLTAARAGFRSRSNVTAAARRRGRRRF